MKPRLAVTVGSKRQELAAAADLSPGSGTTKMMLKIHANQVEKTNNLEICIRKSVYFRKPLEINLFSANTYNRTTELNSVFCTTRACMDVFSLKISLAFQSTVSKQRAIKRIKLCNSASESQFPIREHQERIKYCATTLSRVIDRRERRGSRSLRRRAPGGETFLDRDSCKLMNFFKRKFSFHEEDGETSLEDPSNAAPANAFSFQSIASRVSSTISAPTSPARSSESLAAALERSLQYDRSRAPPVMPPDAKVLLVIDSHAVDWSKYFRNPAEFPIRVEQADFPELDVLCTEHSLTIEICQNGRDPRRAPHQPTTFPVVISVNEGYQGIGKIKVNSNEELCDVEGMLLIMGKGDTEVRHVHFKQQRFKYALLAI
ncbi:hypothetical protein NECAME_07828 [Necator americanus]|uniref:Synapsin pre-ATP-grasp domain-containing protein n=1 Tax=Necator americanus TaxID=51031 RepID=W2TNY1_NECAM|nr:hypothetical protein NECAME_07828 [Necator americanus]ETN82717.1 hypothetical protein NECAME_07828 [Necator americanus]